MTARWTFTDGVETYSFDVNPNAGGSPKLSKRFHRDTPCNPQPGFSIRMEGRPEAPAGQFAGVIRTQLQYETFIDWWERKPVITVTDDLARTFSIVPLNLTMTPGYRRQASWRATYTFDYVLLTPAVI